MTPRCFAAWAKGREQDAQRSSEERMASAYLAAFFTRAERPKPLQFYLKQLRPVKRQSPEEMLAILRQFQAGGAPINIKTLN